MILTKKGSTRGTVSVLLMAALILLGSRVLVGYIEETFPQPSAEGIDWKPIPDVLKKNEKALDDELPTLDNFETTTESAGATSKDVHSESSTSTTNETTSERKSKKRFALERLFRDNINQKPILFFFADEGSILSQRMQKRTLSIAEIRNRINRDFYPVKINFDKPLTKTEYKLYNQYGSAAAPALSIRSATGDNLEYNVGYLNGVKTMVLLQNALNTLKVIDEGGEPTPEL